MVNQRGELVDTRSQPLVRAEIADQADHLANHQEGVAIPGIGPRLLERVVNRGKLRLDGIRKGQVKRSGSSHLHQWNLAGRSGTGALLSLEETLHLNGKLVQGFDVGN